MSSTITDPNWAPTTVITGDIAAEIAALKQQPGKNINVEASGTLVGFLLEQGLLDELHLLVHPIVVGTGKRLFNEASPHIPLRLLESKAFTTGVVYLRFASTGERTDAPTRAFVGSASD